MKPTLPLPCLVSGVELLCLLAVGLLDVHPVHPDSGAGAPREGVRFWSNPLTPTRRRDVGSAARPAQVSVPEVTCTSMEALVRTLQTYGSARASVLKVHLLYDFAFDDMKALVDTAVSRALDEDDYLRFNFANYAARYQGRDGDVSVEFALAYLTSAAQEEYVDQQVAALGTRLFSPGMNQEQLEIAAHDWVVRHVEYDRDGATGDLRYTAFGALSRGMAVCQGYALLSYRLLRAAGLRARIVSGTAGGEDHAWNLVEVCGND